jgi:putative transposase
MLSVSTLVNHLKGVSSRMLRKEFPELAARGAHIWTPSYFAASAAGAPIERPVPISVVVRSRCLG